MAELSISVRVRSGCDNEPGELPQVFKLGHLVTPGFAYSMALTRHKARLDTMQVFSLTLCKSVKSSDRTSFSL